MTTEQKQRSNWLNQEIKRSIDLDKYNHLRGMGARIIYEDNPKKSWELINNITGRKQHEDNFKAIIKPDGSKPKNVAENAKVHASRLQETCSLASDPGMDESWRRHMEEELRQHPEIYTTSPWIKAQELEAGDVRSEMLAKKDQLIKIIRTMKKRVT